MRFESDRHLRVYEWKQKSLEWKEVADLLTADIGNCGYPTVCDGYSICSNGKCSCPEPKDDRRYFKQINDSRPELKICKLHGAEVVDMMRVVAWCLQSDFTKRPSMSVVVKVLEGVVDVEENLDYNFCNPPIPNPRARVMYNEVNVGSATALLDSVLSGPR
nr:hypothetical protein CFP56_75459 [Quercus suber]